MCSGAAHVGVWGNWGSSSSLNAASTRSVWEGSSVSQNVYMLKHACICIHHACNHSNRGRASVLFQYLHANPTSVFLSAVGSCTPACARFRAGKTADGQTDKAEASGPAVPPQKGPAPCPVPAAAGALRCGTRFSARSHSGRRVLERRHQ